MIRCRTIVSHVASESFESGVCRALGALGYEIVPAGEERAPPALRILDAEGLEQLAEEVVPSVPVVLLARDRAHKWRLDPRVIDVLFQPVPLRDLYQVLQRALESTPRSDPRVATARPARCIEAGRIRAGSVISLSEGGCRFRSFEGLPDGPKTNLIFSLPGRQKFDVCGHTAYQDGDDLGLTFIDLDRDSRSIIGQFVLGQLLAAGAGPSLTLTPK